MTNYEMEMKSKIPRALEFLLRTQIGKEVHCNCYEKDQLLMNKMIRRVVFDVTPRGITASVRLFAQLGLDLK